MNRNIVSIDALQKVYASKGYAFFTNGDYNVNVFGVRAYPGTVDKFDDLIGLAYKVDSKWTLKLYDGTTDPGIYWLKNLMNPAGAAILKEGQYKKAYGLGLHRGLPALVQVNPMWYFRDKNRDNNHDMNPSTLVLENAATNLHRASKTGKSINISGATYGWSAGCQVIADVKDMEELLSVCTKASERYGNSFTYTLLNERDFK